MNNKILIISGPTASGKTALALKLAKEFNGELISADSRQVYKGMDIITGKDVPNSQLSIINYQLQKKIQDTINFKVTVRAYEMEGIKLWGTDLVKPDQEFDVNSFVTITQTIIADIQGRGKLSIVVGGTYFYIKNLLNPAPTLGVPINQSLRQQLTSLSVPDLQQRLQENDPAKWEKMNNSDRSNPRRLVRAIEVGECKKNVKYQMTNVKLDNQYDYMWVGLTAPKDIIKQRIDHRVDQRLQQGAEVEVRQLVGKGYDWSLPSMSGIGYRDFRAYLENSQTLEETIKLWKLHEIQYAKRQLSFLKQQKDIQWLDLNIPQYPKQAKVLVQKWLKNS